MPPHTSARPAHRPPAHANRNNRAGRSRRNNRAGSAAARHQLAARTATIVGLGAVALAVLWPSGRDVSGVKDAIGPWFLALEDKDVVLNLVMLAPVTLCACLGWQRIPWWVWALVGCAVGALAESAQWMLPGLDRRPLLSNALENSAGAWAGALLAAALLRSQRRAGGRARRRPTRRRAHRGPTTARRAPAPDPRAFPGA